MDYMKRALELAKEARGYTSPNPPVGAVVVKNGVVVGEGRTQPPGQAHAEVVALKQAGAKAKGATLFVTLEPCCHTDKRTPPCTKAIIDAGVSGVHIGTLDANPSVHGNGTKELRDAGIRVTVGEHEVQAQEMVEAHTKWITTGLPFVIAKFASSHDGRMARGAGESQWITSEESRMHANRELRHWVDAILVGVNTVIKDDPMLTARDASGTDIDRQPLRVVLDSKAKTPAGAKALSGNGMCLIAATELAPASKLRALKKAGAEVVVLPSKDGLVSLQALMEHLGNKLQITSVLIEGGATVLKNVLAERLADKVYAYVAPEVIGGETPSVVAGASSAAGIARALQLERVRRQTIGGDILIVGYPKKTK